MRNKILLGLTTTPKSDWKQKIKDIDRLGLKEIALFPTCLSPVERQELYEMLENTKLERIPHVHLREDFTDKEIDYLIKKYKTEVFNTHSGKYGLPLLKLTKNQDKIFVENTFQIDSEYRHFVNRFGGICIDFSHWEDIGVMQGVESYKNFESLIKLNKVGCCHISGVQEKLLEAFDEKGSYYSVHTMGKLSDLDYMKKYVKYLPKYVSLELENSFEQQLEAKEYLEKIIRENKE